MLASAALVTSQLAYFTPGELIGVSLLLNCPASKIHLVRAFLVAAVTLLVHFATQLEGALPGLLECPTTGETWLQVALVVDSSLNTYRTAHVNEQLP